MQRFSVKTRLGFRCLNEDTTAVRAVCSSVLGLESPSYVIAAVRGRPPPIRVHSWFNPHHHILRFIRENPCQSVAKKTLNSNSSHQHWARAGKPELHNRTSPWHTAPHSCPFVSIRVHSWFKITTFTPCGSSVNIRVNPWRKKLSTATAAISTGLGLESPSYIIAPVRGPPNTTPFVSIRGSKHHLRGSNPPLTD